MALVQSSSQPRGLQPWITVSIVVGVILTLVGGYLLFRGPNFTLLYSDLPLTTSASVVAELKARGTNYRLSDGGRTILVPDGEVNEVRVGLSGAGGALTGTDGFELFNESEMGLTEFTQRIKYLRAVQGELARTIIAMEKVEDARVHLAMPERSVFKAERVAPKAAVSLTMEAGSVAGEATILGIQELIAATIPDLDPSTVVVLNGRGEPISLIRQAPVVEERVVATGLVSQELAREFRAIISEQISQARIDMSVDAVNSAIDQAGSNALAQVMVKISLKSSEPLQEAQLIDFKAAMEPIAKREGFNGIEINYLGSSLLDTPPPIAAVPLNDEAVSPSMQNPGLLGKQSKFFDFLVGPRVLMIGTSVLASLAVLLLATTLWRRRTKAIDLETEAEARERASELRRVLYASEREMRDVA
jgi:hypothetical protein